MNDQNSSQTPADNTFSTPVPQDTVVESKDNNSRKKLALLLLLIFLFLVVTLAFIFIINNKIKPTNPIDTTPVVTITIPADADNVALTPSVMITPSTAAVTLTVRPTNTTPTPTRTAVPTTVAPSLTPTAVPSNRYYIYDGATEDVIRISTDSNNAQPGQFAECSEVGLCVSSAKITWLCSIGHPLGTCTTNIDIGSLHGILQPDQASTYVNRSTNFVLCTLAHQKGVCRAK